MADAQLKASVVIDLTGNLQRQAQRYQQSLDQFAQRGGAIMGRMSGVAQGLDRTLESIGNRYVALATGGAVVAAAKQVVDFDAAIMALAVDTDLADDRLAALKQRIFEVANQANIRVAPTSLLAGVKDLAARTGDIDEAIRNMEAIGLVMRATGASGEDAGAMIANYSKKFGIGAQDMAAALGITAKMGKAGAFEMRHLAAESNTVVTAYANTGRTGTQAAREMLAMLQMIMGVTGSAAEASTAFDRLISVLTSQDAAEFQKNGIQIWDAEELAKGNKVARAVPDIIEDILKKAKADPEILAKVFPDVRANQAMRAFAADYRRNGSLKELREMLQIDDDGSQLIKDASRNASTALATMTSLATATEKIADQNLSEPIQNLADAINQLEPEKLNELADYATKAAIGLGAMAVSYKGLKMVLPAGTAAGAAGAGSASSATGTASGVINNSALHRMMTGSNAPLRVPSPWLEGMKTMPSGSGNLLGTVGRGLGIAGAAYGLFDFGRGVSRSYDADGLRAYMEANGYQRIDGEQPKAKLEIELTGPGARFARVRRSESEDLDVVTFGAVMGTR